MTVVCKEVCEIKKVIQVTKYVALGDKRESDRVKDRPREIGSEGRCWRVGYIH